MSCISVTHTPIGGIYVTTRTVGGITASAFSVGGITASCTPVGGIYVTTTRVGGISVKMWQECSTNIRKNYLEIEPTVVWVLNGWTSNDVYSNTTWNVD